MGASTAEYSARRTDFEKLSIPPMSTSSSSTPNSTSANQITAAGGSDRPFRILFACPQTVFDVSNGASLQSLTFLQELARRGLKVATIGGAIFDNPSGLARIPNLEEQIKANAGKKILINQDHSAGGDFPITHHFFTGFHSTVWSEMTYDEANSFLSEYTQLLRTYKPDLVIGYGCDPVCRSMWMEAKLFGIPTVYLICNGNHHHYRFPLHDLVLTDSQATAELYKNDDGLTVQTIGNFINPETVVAKNRNPQTVTFINPAFAKGSAIVARLLLMANKERPDIPFMVVESRQKFADALRALKAPRGEPGSAFPDTVTFEHIALRPATFNISEIYATTKVLLAPSLWYESLGRVATEATMNGIPVLASKSGGLPEAVGAGGITMDVPASNQGPDDNWLVLPTEEECRPWADALYELFDHADEWRGKCLEAAHGNSIEVRGDRLMALLMPLLSRRAGDADFSRLGSIRYENDPIDWEGRTWKAAVENA